MKANELVALLSEVQKEELTGQQYSADSYFNPIQDADRNWIISTQEQEFCTNSGFLWVKDSPLIPYNPITPGPIP